MEVTYNYFLLAAFWIFIVAAIASAFYYANKKIFPRQSFILPVIFFLLAVLGWVGAEILKEQEFARIPEKYVKQGETVYTNGKAYTCKKDASGNTYFTHIVLPYRTTSKSGATQYDGYESYTETVRYSQWKDPEMKTVIYFRLVCSK